MVSRRPYPRGFLITRVTDMPKVPEAWSTLTLPCAAWHFSYDEHYAPDIAFDQGSPRWVLVHGLCLYAGDKALKGTVADHLLKQWNSSNEQFLSALDELGGRHIILRGAEDAVEVYHDAAGMRSVYSSREFNTVSSHAHLINVLYPHRERKESEGARALTHSWDHTKYVGIEPLLPNHRLRLPDWTVDRYFPRTTNAYAGWGLEAKLDRFQRLWSNQLARLSELDSSLVMSITGGADSRTSLALSADYLEEIEFFTYTARKIPGSKWSESMALDRELVEQLKRFVSFKHRYFESENRDTDTIRELEPLLKANSTQQHSRWLVAFYAAAFPGEGHIHLRGNGYEIGRAYWGLTEDNDTLASLKNLYMQITKGDQGYVSPEDRRAYYDQGVRKWGYDGERHGYHVRDLAYWEIRCGRWLSEILNETDLAFQTLVPINVRALLDISLSMTLQERQESFIFWELINRSMPVLNFPGKNDVRNLYEQMRDERLSHEGRHTAADTAKLSATLEVRGPVGPVLELDAVGNELSLPSYRFTPHTTASRAFLAPTSMLPQTLTFVVDAPYCNLRAVGQFQFEVHLDGRPVASWDGAAFKRPVHVTVDDLTRETAVSIVIRSLSNQQGKSSWESASQAFIRAISFTTSPPSARERRPAVWTDAPK